MRKIWFDPDEPPFHLGDEAWLFSRARPLGELFFSDPRYGDSHLKLADGSRGLKFADTRRKVSVAQVEYYLRTGHWEPRAVRFEHVNGDLTDDRFENLRHVVDVPKVESRPRNGRKRIRPVGVSRFGRRWQAYVRLNGARYRRIGIYRTQEEAEAARKRWDDAQDLV